MSIIQDYAVTVEASTAIPQVSFAFLDKICAVAKVNGTGVEDTITEVFSIAEIEAITDNTSIKQALASGATSVFVITKATLDIANLLDANLGEFFTVLITEDFNKTEVDAADLGLFDGVVGWSNDVEVDVDAFGDVAKQSGFLDSGNVSEGMFHAFTRLFATHVGREWFNQQYIDAGTAVVNPVLTLGAAESEFANRVSFFLQDDTNLGIRLGFFAAGGQGISQPYVEKQSALEIQQVGLNFIANTQPNNTPATRASLGVIFSDVLDLYVASGGILTFNVRVEIVTTEFFKASYSGNIVFTSPLWRTKLVTLNSVSA